MIGYIFLIFLILFFYIIIKIRKNKSNLNMEYNSSSNEGLFSKVKDACCTRLGI
jgi:heme/copper-type cytochrome/quinol oxidase subunit 2